MTDVKRWNWSGKLNRYDDGYLIESMEHSEFRSDPSPAVVLASDFERLTAELAEAKAAFVGATRATATLRDELREANEQILRDMRDARIRTAEARGQYDQNVEQIARIAALEAERDAALARERGLREALEDAIENSEGDLMAVGHSPDGPRRIKEMRYLKEKIEKWSAALAASVASEPLSVQPSVAPVEPPKIWYMRDNHTFLPLPLDADKAIELMRGEWCAGYTYGVLCSKQLKIGNVHAKGKEKWDEFERECRKWFARASVPATEGPGK